MKPPAPHGALPGDPCPRCDRPLVVEFQHPVCTTSWCGTLAACCGNQAPYESTITTYTLVGVDRRTAVFCRTCGRELARLASTE